jgi:uncharacterized protein YqiB (DUF1249 family)
MGNRYIPDLPRMMAFGEQNYALLMLLLQNEATSTSIYFECGGEMNITVEQSAPYTWFLKIESHSLHAKLAGFLSLYVRLYLDARIAEVYGSRDNKRLKPIFTLPNKTMAQVDEKEQLNFLLNELLMHARQKGLSCPQKVVNKL